MPDSGVWRQLGLVRAVYPLHERKPACVELLGLERYTVDRRRPQVRLDRDVWSAFLRLPAFRGAENHRATSHHRGSAGSCRRTSLTTLDIRRREAIFRCRRWIGPKSLMLTRSAMHSPPTETYQRHKAAASCSVVNETLAPGNPALACKGR